MIKEITYPIKSCPCCGYSAEAKLGHSLLDEGWYVQCTKCHIRTTIVLINCPTLNGEKYDYYGALKAAVDTWNTRASVEVNK